MKVAVKRGSIGVPEKTRTAEKEPKAEVNISIATA